jgi:hypothetical protein
MLIAIVIVTEICYAVGTTNHQETCWYQGKIMDFYSEGPEFGSMPNLCAEFFDQI